MASELQKTATRHTSAISHHIPQTIPTGQMPSGMTGVLMPQGMTGVLASERGKIYRSLHCLAKTSYKAILTLTANWLVLQLHPKSLTLKIF